MRTCLVGNRDSEDDLGKLVHLLNFHLPKSYLEDYTRFCASFRAAGWPKSPRLIISSNAFIADDDWKCWAGQAVETGSRLVISQHGGHYGIGAISAAEDFECKLADAYLSWGWKDRAKGNVLAAPAAKLLNLPNYVGEKSSSGLLVVGSVPRWPQRVFSASLGPQFASYIEDQILFLSALDQEIRREFTVRLPEFDFGWKLKERFSEAEPLVSLDDASSAFIQSAVRRRLVVGTYNGTATLETLAMGVPTVFFWNPNQWGVRSTARPLLNGLRNVGIFFDSPIECAGHINRIWSDIPAWWKSRCVQQAVKDFTNSFALTSRQPVTDIRHILMGRLASE